MISGGVHVSKRGILILVRGPIRRKQLRRERMNKASSKVALQNYEINSVTMFFAISRSTEYYAVSRKVSSKDARDDMSFVLGYQVR